MNTSEQMQFKEFQAVTIATPDVVYISRSETFEPLLVEEARKIIHGIQNLPEKMEVNKLTKKLKSMGLSAASGTLLTSETLALQTALMRGPARWRNAVLYCTANTHEEFTYTQFVRDRDKLYPGLMHGYERGVLAEEAGAEK